MKKNKFISPLLISSVVLISGVSPDVMAQFNKYKSKTKFTPTKSKTPTSTPPIVDIPDTGKSAKSLIDKKLNGDTTNFADDEENSDENTDVAQTDDSSEESSAQTFGRKSAAPTNPSKIDKKYVNLNPETAFGPEVVTSFDFPNVSILDLTKHMQKLTGLNLILDKDIKGKISISTPSPITMGDAWKAYLEALSINGYSLVKTGAYYTIVNNRDIRYSPTTMYTGTYSPNTENYVMQIIPLKYVASREVANSFRPFMSRYGRIIEIKQTNTVIVQETGTHINRLMKLIKFIDIPGHEEGLQIIKVKNSSAQEIATLLDKILKGNQTDQKFKTSVSTGQTSQISISRIIAEPRTNSIIAMANADGARELKELINKLDVKVVAAGSGQVHVYYLNYGDAESLSKTLTTLVGSAGKSTGSALGGLTRFTSNNATAATSSSLFNSDVKITADKDNNALVVNASPTDYETVKAVIAKLDIPRDQVFVEGLMMETNVGRDNKFGVSMIGAYGSGGTQKSGYGNTNDLMSLMTNNITNLSGLFVGIGAGRKVSIPTGTGSNIEINSVSGLISAIASNASTNVLATPQILTLDNVEGIFKSGEKVPTLETTTANNTTQTSTKQQDVKLELKITPQINKATHFIKLKIDQTIQDFSSRSLPKNLQDNGIGVIERSINTTVIVRDRDTIAMGGLMRDKELNSTSKVPLLGDIPVLGWLFKNTTKTVEKVNLLFFMTPKILSSYEKANAENVKDLLNRRQAHLKNASLDTDTNASTVKGLYEKAKKQAEGPLYDVSEASKYQDKNAVPEVNFGGGSSSTSVEPIDNSAATEAVDAPDYQQILNQVNDKSSVE
jgi:general secretion pathway protein D